MQTIEHTSNSYNHLISIAESTFLSVAIKQLDTKLTGLSNQEVKKRRRKYGHNEVVNEKITPWYTQLFQAFMNPFIMVLALLGVISLFTDVILVSPKDRSYETIIILVTMVLLSSFLRFWQEYKSSKAAAKLRAMVHTTVAVLRNGAKGPKEIPITELVPGDILYLNAGDMIPADVYLIESRDLYVGQAILTGESVPVEKYDAKTLAAKGLKSASTQHKNILELHTICFMGTTVVNGKGTAVVVATGAKTYFGSMTNSITGDRVTTSFDIGINQVSWLLIRFMVVVVPIVFIINGISKGDWLQALLFSVSVAVGLTPEMLPMIVSTNLAKGAVAMSKHKVIVKRINSIQNFGAMNILCTDKTGTLTQDKIILERHLNVNGEKDLKALEYAWLNSSNQSGIRHLLDMAILHYAEQHQVIDKLANFKKIDEIPFDFIRRRISVVVSENKENSDNLLICKGAIEEILSLCSYVDNNGKLEKITPERHDNILKLTRDLNSDGMMVLAVAYKNIKKRDSSYTAADETDMTLLGYVAFLDPPKDSVRSAIEALKELHVEVKIITGDNEIITSKICREVKLAIKGVMLGHQLESLSDDQLAKEIANITIFAKVSPMQKARIIKVLRSLDNTVGYMGDGVNDAAALREADVGISVDTGVDIAKESSDIILLEKSLMVLKDGVIEGRKTFANIMKYIKMAASSNFGNIFSVLIASIFLPFLPMLSIHLLIQNLLYDISQISIPWDHVDKEYIDKPRKWETSGLAKFMVCIGPISSIFDIVTFLVLWFVFKANAPQYQSVFQSGWFIEGLLSQTLIVHMIRTEKIPFFQSMPSAQLVILTLIVAAIGIMIPFSQLGEHIGLHPLPSSYFIWLTAIILGYCTLIQFAKRIYIAKFKEWL